MTCDADRDGLAILAITGWARTEGEQHLIGSVPVTALEEQWRDQRVTARLPLRTDQRGVLMEPQQVDLLRLALTSEPDGQAFEVIGRLVGVMPDRQQITVQVGAAGDHAPLTVRATTSLLRYVDPAWEGVQLTGCLIERMLVADATVKTAVRMAPTAPLPLPEPQKQDAPVEREPARFFVRRSLAARMSSSAQTTTSAGSQVVELRGRPYTVDADFAPYLVGLTWYDVSGTPTVRVRKQEAANLGLPFVSGKMYTLRRFFAILVYDFHPNSGMTLRHLNGDDTDFRLENLAPTTVNEVHTAVASRGRKDNALPPGVTRLKSGNFRVRVSLPGVGQVALGTYPTAQAASEAQEKALRDPASVR